MTGGGSIIFHPRLNLVLGVVLLDNLLVVVFVQHLNVVLRLHLSERHQVLRLVRVRVNHFQLVRKQIDVVDEVLRLLPTVLERVGQCWAQVLKNLRPLHIDLGVVGDSHFALRPPLVDSLHLLNELGAVQVSQHLNHVVFSVNWSEILDGYSGIFNHFWTFLLAIAGRCSVILE